jgi:hypothetical protein
MISPILAKLYGIILEKKINYGIYIDKLEECLEKASCVGPTLTGIVIILLLYADDIVLMARSPHDLENQLR